MDGLHKALQQNAFDALVKLGYPVLEICVAFEIEAIDLAVAELLLF